ncbi:secretion system protein E [Paraburkholderia sp. UYCP14C]|uniref:ATPase, T2SS/T4P/T4SS family n=1 Tax=Paraburkholderia sp. UYCP14C TaxID=2511130 RepID=UPI00101E8E80|nr:ATPase, T2SS/T4P/T4SS family [Paraburkholderia sp. UYCP14C]RZF24313.1 secretion system protein E [Paraburkholderia sp. UYCP14C]
MGIFSGVESGDVQSSGGFLKRFRAVRPTAFVEPGQAAGNATGQSGQEPTFREPTRAANPSVSFLGRKLSGDDVEDVESFTELDASVAAPAGRQAVAAAPAPCVPTQPTAPVSTPEIDADSASPVSPERDASTTSARADMASTLGDAYGEGEKTLRELDALIAAQRGTAERVSRSAADAFALEPQSGAQSQRQPQPQDRPDGEDTTGQEAIPSPALPAESALRMQAVPRVTAPAEAEEDDGDEPTGERNGRPVLVSADALPDFKRVVTGTDSDATLRLSAAARKEFVAVEIQPGIAIVAATARFSERAQFTTFVKDLAARDLLVQEEMIATEEVIAAIYEGKKREVSGNVEREASRAIGNFRDVIEAAHSYGASDIAIEPRDFRGEVEVRFRVNGDVYTYRRLPKNIVRRALSAAYSDLVQKNTNSGNSFQPSAPQSAMIPLVVGRDTINLRWQSAPTVGGYDVALRLLDGNFKNYSVLMPHQMGLAPSQLALIDTLNYVSGGITVLTGETGSGKTTLLRALSYMLPDRELKKQFAVSEPSEYPLPWLSEISIIRRPDESDDEANRKYAEVIRTLMRMDPDDVTISEVRDRVVMGLVSELALTGHPVRFSLHAGDIISAFMRMAGGRLVLPIDELAAEGFVNAVGNQKLIPTLCPNCKLPAEDVMQRSDLELLRAKFGLDTSRMACRNHDGCQHCRLDGLFSRDGKVAGGTKRPTLVAELYRPTEEFRERIAARDWAGARKVWRGERQTGFDKEDMTGKTVYEHALFKASRGEIDPQFINRSMQSFAQYRVFPGAGGKL